MRPIHDSLAALTAIVLLTAVSHLALVPHEATSSCEDPAPADRQPAAPAPVMAESVPAATRQPVGGAASRRLLSMSPGRHLTYTLAASYETRVAVAGGPARTALSFRLAATMGFEVVACREGEVLASMTLSRPELWASAEGGQANRQRDVERALASPALLRLGATGELLGCCFTGDSTPESRSWLRALCATFRFVVHEDAGQAWTTAEADVTGRWTVGYRRQGARVWRSRTACEPLADNAGARLVVRDDSECEFDAGAGWIGQARCAQSVTMVRDDVDMGFEMRETATLALTACATGVARADAEAWNGPWVDTASNADQALIAARREASETQASLAGVTLERLLAELAGLVSSGQRDTQDVYEARSRLAALLRAKPGQIEALAALVRARGLPDDTIALVLGAAGSAATEPAQRLLADVAADPAAPQLHRLAALQSMFQLGYPSGRVVECVREQLASPVSVLRASALLLLGRLASTRPELCEDLERLEPRVRAEGQLSTYLEALGNARAWSAVERHAQSDDPALRVRAQQVLARR